MNSEARWGCALALYVLAVVTISAAMDNVADDVLTDAIFQAFSNGYMKRTLRDNVVAQRKYQRKLKGGGA